jgi:hypothetical protein
MLMKDAYEALKQKEADLSRVRHEIESLRIVASLLLDDLNSDQSDKPRLKAWNGGGQRLVQKLICCRLVVLPVTSIAKLG